MTPQEERRLAAVEQQLADALRELRATHARLSVLRALLADEAAAVDTVSGPGEATAARPVLRLIEGGRGGARRPGHGRNRHGLRAV